MSVTTGSRSSACRACEQIPATSVLLVYIQAPQSGRLSIVQQYILSKAVEHRWFLRTSGLSGVLKGLLLERDGQLSCNPKKKKKNVRYTMCRLSMLRLGTGDGVKAEAVRH